MKRTFVLFIRDTLEWAQNIADDPAGLFDLRIEPWGSNWQTPDIWVDRNPFGSFDKPNDSAGRPQDNGDQPKPREINKFFARIHNVGGASINNVNVTFYTANPPGVGDSASFDF